MAVTPPFNLKKWIDENRDKLKPPVGNVQIYKNTKDYIVMVVGGPNARKDYHYNETEELFYQIEGDISVFIQDEGEKKEIVIKEGEMFLLPPRIPHSPVRGDGTVGLVIERIRESHHKDGLIWYSDKANAKLYEEYFHLTNIEKDFLPVFKRFYSNEKLRTCPETGEIMEVDPRFVD